MKPRKTAPNKALGYGDQAQSFRVWVYQRSYMEDPFPWKCVAAFQFLTEALDYIAYCQDGGGNVVFQSPADCKPVLATDRRVVYKAPVQDEERGCNRCFGPPCTCTEEVERDC